MLSVRRGYTTVHALPLPAMASVNAALFYCYCCQLALCAKYGGTSEMKIISELLVLQRDFRALYSFNVNVCTISAYVITTRIRYNRMQFHMY